MDDIRDDLDIEQAQQELHRIAGFIAADGATIEPARNYDRQIAKLAAIHPRLKIYPRQDIDQLPSFERMQAGVALREYAKDGSVVVVESVSHIRRYGTQAVRANELVVPKSGVGVETVLAGFLLRRNPYVLTALPPASEQGAKRKEK